MKIKLFICLLGILCLLVGVSTASADGKETWDTLSDGNYSIRYPDDTMHGFSAIDYDWEMDVILDVEAEETVALAIVFTGPEDWEKWLSTGEYPDDKGHQEAMNRLIVDEPPTTPAVDAEIRYALYSPKSNIFKLAKAPRNIRSS